MDIDVKVFGLVCFGWHIGLRKRISLEIKHTKLCKLVEPRKNSNQTHDLGFVFYPSFCIGYDVTKMNI